MMSSKRFKDQILAQILRTCAGEGKSKTKVVYASGLNFKTIMPYLITLDKNGLIEIIPGEYPIYRITQKGEKALIHLRALEELIPIYIFENSEKACEKGT
jgi:predicted transcriptional regulator